jgi:hypothetical protein
MLDNYLNKLQGIDPDPIPAGINEGVLTSLNNFFVLMGMGKPADRRVEVHRIAHQKCTVRCWKAHPGEKTTTTKRSTDYDDKQSDKEIKQEREETITRVKENPELGKCLLVCKATLLDNVIKVIKKNRKTICMKNINRDLCEKWVNRYLPEIEADLKSLKELLKSMGKAGGKGGNVNITVNQLKKIL